MGKTNELKPCPFCGNSDVLESDIKEVHPTFGISGYAVWCGNCGAYGGSRNTKQESIDAWNRRANMMKRVGDNECITEE